MDTKDYHLYKILNFEYFYFEVIQSCILIALG